MYIKIKINYNSQLICIKGDGLYYPCRVIGVGPSSTGEREYALVEFVGYGTRAEVSVY